MRVGIVCPYDLGRFGGVQDQCFKLARWLNESDHEAVVVGPGEGPPGTISLGPVTVVPANGAATPISLRPGVGRQLEAALHDRDVVHIHEPLMPTVSLASTRLTATPKVGTFHADPSPMIRRLYRLGAAPLRSLVRRLDIVTAVSPVAAGAVERFARTRIVPNGLEVGAYETGPKGAHTVGFIGRDDPRKGLDVLLAAWPHVQQAIPEARLRVVAEGREGTSPGIEFLGAISEADKRTFLGETQVMVAPNLSGESFGIVLVEAMASAGVVVASALPAFVAVLGDSGVLVKPGDAADLARSLIGLLRDGDKISRLSAAALERSRRFDRSTVVAGYLAAYHDAVDAQGT